MSDPDEDFKFDVQVNDPSWGQDEGTKKLFHIIIGLHVIFLILIGTLYLLTFVEPYGGYINKFISLAIG